MPVNRNRGTKKEDVASFNPEYSTLLEVKKQVENWIERYGPNATFAWVQEPYSDYRSLVLQIDRPETDLEMRNRIANEESWEEAREEREKKEYERLQKKFGKQAS